MAGPLPNAFPARRNEGCFQSEPAGQVSAVAAALGPSGCIRGNSFSTFPRQPVFITTTTRG